MDLNQDKWPVESCDRLDTLSVVRLQPGCWGIERAALFQIRDEAIAKSFC